MNTPVVPRSAKETAPDRRQLLTDLRRFHFGDPDAQERLAPAGNDLVPLLLHAYRDARGLRSDFPLLVQREPVFAATPLSEVLREAAETARNATGDLRLVADNLRRVERIAAEVLATAGGRLAAKVLFEEAGRALELELDLAAAPREQLRAQWSALCAAAPQQGEFIGLDADTGLRLFVAAALADHDARHADLLREVQRLHDLLRVVLEQKQRKDHGPLGSDAGPSLGRMFDTGALARVVGPHRGTLRLDERRRARVGEALAELGRFLAQHREIALHLVHAPELGVVVDDAQVRTHPDGDPCRAALQVFAQESDAMARTFRALRLAALEVEGAYDPDRHDAWLAAFGPGSFSVDELLACPRVIVVETAARLCGSSMARLSQVLRSARPVQVLALMSTAAVDLDEYRLEPGYLGIAHREAFVQQSMVARPQHLARGLARALRCACPGLHVVATPLDEERSMARRLDPWLDAGAAVEGRAHPLFRYDPTAGVTWAKRLDFEGNPAPAEDWPQGETVVRAADGSGATLAARFTFADHALLQSEVAREFAMVDVALDGSGPGEDALCPIEDLLALEPEVAQQRIPCLRAVDGAGRVVRLVISRRLLRACRDRLDFWRTLQELAGVRNEYVREAVARAIEAAEAKASAARAELEVAHAAALEQVRATCVNEAMGALADSLLELGPAPLLSAVVATTPPSPGPVTPAVAGPAPVAAAAVAVEAKVEFEEPWIDTPLCTSCNDCRNLNPLLFVYDANKQAKIGDPRKGTYAQLVQAAEKCPSRCIHPGLPLDPNEPGAAELIARAAPFNR